MAKLNLYTVTVETRATRTFVVAATDAAEATQTADALYFNLNLGEGNLQTIDHEIVSVEEVAGATPAAEGR